MKKYFITLTILLICGNAFGRLKEPITIEKPVEKTSDYWVYVRLEDRSGVTTEDDAGRSKAGDVVAVLPVSPQHIPSETEKKSYMIYKASLTESKRQEMLEPMVEETGQTDESGQPILKTVAYRKNKLDTSKLGVAVKKGLVAEKIDATKIEYSVKTSDDLARYEVKRKFYAYVQRPAIRLANVITRKAFAETVSTCNKTGEDYNTISLWEDDKDGDLVTDTRQETLEVYDDDGTLTDSFTVLGSTTSSSYYMKVTSPAGERHDGTGGSGAKVNSTDQYNGIYIQDDYFVIEWMEISRNTSSTGAVQGRYLLYVNGGNEVTIRNNIFHDSDVAYSSTAAIAFNDNQTAGNEYYIHNNIIYDITGTSSADGIRVGQYNSVTFNISNNTIYGLSGTGINCTGPYNDTDGIYVVKNNISMGNGNDYSGSIDTDINNLETGATVTFVSTTSGSEDFHLTSASTDAIDQGSDLSGTFTDDIDGDTRSGTWDIGADEYVASNRLMIIQ